MSGADVESLARSDVEGSVLRLEGELPPHHVTLVPALAHVIRQPPEQRSWIDRPVDVRELHGDVTGFDSPDFAHTFLFEDDYAVVAPEHSHVVLLPTGENEQIFGYSPLGRLSGSRHAQYQVADTQTQAVVHAPVGVGGLGVLRLDLWRLSRPPMNDMTACAAW
jgi:hypothetical protein